MSCMYAMHVFTARIHGMYKVIKQINLNNFNNSSKIKLINKNAFIINFFDYFVFPSLKSSPSSSRD